MPMATAISAVMREPQQRLAGQPRGVGDLLQVGDADDDRGDDQRRDERLQQRHEGAADGLRGCWSASSGCRRTTGPISRATSPRPMPRTRARRTCAAKGTRRRRASTRKDAFLGGGADEGRRRASTAAVVVRPWSSARRRVRPHTFCTGGASPRRPGVIPGVSGFTDARGGSVGQDRGATRAGDPDRTAPGRAGAVHPGLAGRRVPALGGRPGSGGRRCSRRAPGPTSTTAPPTWGSSLPDGAGGLRGPPLPWLGSFLETNVRLYSVDERGRRGVVFRSPRRRSAPAGARRGRAAGLPYRVGGRSASHGSGTGARYARRHPTAGRPSCAWGRRSQNGPLEEFLTARWGLHHRAAGRTRYTAVEHGPWELSTAELVRCDTALLSAAGLPRSTGQPVSVLFSPRMDRVRIGTPA